MPKKESKRGQLTIFIIIAIVIAAVLLIVFYPRLKILITPSEPVSYMQTELEGRLKESVNAVMLSGGSINPDFSMQYEGKKIEYLCFTNQYYETCTMQRPLLKPHIEREIKQDINSDVLSAIENMKQSMEKRGYRTETRGQQEFNVEIIPQGVLVTVKPDVVFVKENTGERFEELEITYPSKAYNLIDVAEKILNWEAVYGDTDIMNFMLFYPNVKVEKYKQGDGSTVYKLKERNTNEEFVFATRSLAWAPGYGFGKTISV